MEQKKSPESCHPIIMIFFTILGVGLLAVVGVSIYEPKAIAYTALNWYGIAIIAGFFLVTLVMWIELTLNNKHQN